MDNPNLQNSDADLAKSKTSGEKKSLRAYSFEEAVGETEVGKFHYILLFIVGMCFVACMTEITSLGVMMFPAKCDLHFTLAEQGLLGSASFLGVAVSAHFVGILADTWGRVRSLRVLLMISLCTSLISTMSPNVGMLFVFRFLTGMAISGCQSCVYSLLGEFHSSKTRGKHIAMVSTFMPTGMMIVPIMAYFILPMDVDIHFLGFTLMKWRIVMILNLLPSMAALAGVLWLPETPKYLLSQGKHSESVDVLRRMYSMNSGNPKHTYPCEIVTLQDVSSDLSKVKGVGEILKLAWNQTIALFTEDRIFQTLNMCTMTFTINLVVQGTFLYLPLISKNLLTHTEGSITICKAFEVIGQTKSNQTLEEMCDDPDSLNPQQYIYLVYIYAGFIIGYVFTFSVIDYTGKKLLLTSLIIFGAVCALLLQWIVNIVLVLICLTASVAVGSNLAIVSSIALEFYPTNINAMAVSFVMMIGRFGAVVGTNIVGPLLLAHCGTLFFVNAGTLAFIAFLSTFLSQGRTTK